MSGYFVEFIDLDSARFQDSLRLAFSVLYEPFGLQWPEESSTGADWLHPEPGTHVAVALDDGGKIIGSARLLPGSARRQVRQVAVATEARRLGVGRALMSQLESRAAEQGAHEIWLNSRNTAYGFYGALGYRIEGDEFVSEITGIPHRLARKALG